MSSKLLTIRSYDKERDRSRVEELERNCEVGSRKKSSVLLTDTLGDPLCRIVNSPMYEMLVAEHGDELVGIIRGSIKFVSIGNPTKDQARVGYILGLRVSPLHRRRGIGSLLVCKIEEWFMANHVEYAYMATDMKNEASIKLFIGKLGYSKFRSPTILVNPVGQHAVHISPSTKITKLNIAQAEHLLRKFMSSIEFFPKDIDQLLANRLSLGTWIAVHARDDQSNPKSWAMVSVWNCGDIFKLRVEGAPRACVLLARTSRLISKLLSCINIRAMPDIFNLFGFYFMYGIHGEGPEALSLVRSLCHYVHNLAIRCQDCKLVVTEIGGCDTLKHAIPHWNLLSCSEDLWCIKAMTSKKADNSSSFDWIMAQPPPNIFVDPRDV
ncbi:probable N-acetyltransferase HLS1 [Dioscorea cayenensis subsp. rotundata]|uniref:Probable N-acetyltransferase HLS1 n=1 Tax=Dioscorea cayennensis subsp. rotundata TaxID=55577 RepID=A0AB40CZ03_DIOCR|nr:probable N-acetyltransferase HLS1 [Dioscorea cayenensis subsp. rotundata]